MPTDRLLVVEMQPGLSVSVDVNVPEKTRTKIQSHSCWYTGEEQDGAVCAFTMSFKLPVVVPEADFGVALGAAVVLLGLLGRRRRSRISLQPPERA